MREIKTVKLSFPLLQGATSSKRLKEILMFFYYSSCLAENLGIIDFYTLQQQLTEVISLILLFFLKLTKPTTNARVLLI